MININKYEAKTEEEAIKQACDELKVEEKDLIIDKEFVEGKLFKSSKYILSVINKNDIKQYINDFFKQIGTYMNLNIEVEIHEEDNIYSVIIVSDNNAILIGKEGKTLNSLQILIRNVLKAQTNSQIKVNLDVSNYKIKKLKNIERLVRGIAEDVEASQITVSLDPMNSYERRFVHTLIDEYPHLVTESVGEGKERHVTIKYVEEK